MGETSLMRVIPASGYYPLPMPSARSAGVLPAPHVVADTTEDTSIPASTGTPLPVIAQTRAGHVEILEAALTDRVRGHPDAGQRHSPQAQRALAEYQDIASQEQRLEIAQVLGFDAYA